MPRWSAVVRAVLRKRARGLSSDRSHQSRGSKGGGGRMKLCVGTSKGIVVLDAERKGKPLMALADPPSVWCMAQDCRDPGTIYAGSVDHAHMGSARGRVTLARSNDGGRTWADITPGIARNEDVWAIA